MSNVRYKNIWEQLPEPKAEYHNFYNRISTGHYTVAEAAQPGLIKKDRRSEKRIFYDNYEGDKVGWSMFDKRVSYMNMKFEDAIKKTPRSKKTVSSKYKYLPVKLNKTHAQTKADRDNPEHHFIRVTMKEEEAREYHRVYRSMIEELEQKIYSLEDTSILTELESKLKFIKEQYQVFLTFNPIISGANNLYHH